MITLNETTCHIWKCWEDILYIFNNQRKKAEKAKCKIRTMMEDKFFGYMKTMMLYDR